MTVDPKVSDDPLEGLEDHLKDPAEGARKAGEDVSDDNPDDDAGDDVVDDAASDDDNVDDDKDSDLDDDDDLTLQERYDYLKKEVGRQANEIGDLTGKLKDQAPAPVAAPVAPVADPTQVKIDAAKKRWSADFVEDMLDIMDSRMAPVQKAQGQLALEKRYENFTDVRADMDEIFKASPALREAAEKDVTVLDTVHAAATKRADARKSSESGQKDEARRKRVNEAKDNAHVEKPSLKADTPKRESQKEKDQGFVDHLIGLPPNA